MDLKEGLLQHSKHFETATFFHSRWVKDPWLYKYFMICIKLNINGERLYFITHCKKIFENDSVFLYAVLWDFKNLYIIAKMIVNHVTFIKMQLQLQYRKVLQNKHLLWKIGEICSTLLLYHVSKLYPLVNDLCKFPWEIARGAAIKICHRWFSHKYSFSKVTPRFQ